MNKTELIKRIAEVSKLTQTNSETILNTTLSKIQEPIKMSATDFAKLNKSKNKKGKYKKNWE